MREQRDHGNAHSAGRRLCRAKHLRRRPWAQPKPRHRNRAQGLALGLGVLKDAFRPFANLMTIYEARANASVHELSGLLDVAEADASLGHELSRWRWMPHDYTLRLDPELTIGSRRSASAWVPTSTRVREIWNRVLDCRQLDACLRLLLARTTMLDPNARPSIVQGLCESDGHAGGRIARVVVPLDPRRVGGRAPARRPAAGGGDPEVRGLRPPQARGTRAGAAGGGAAGVPAGGG